MNFDSSVIKSKFLALAFAKKKGTKRNYSLGMIEDMKKGERIMGKSRRYLFTVVPRRFGTVSRRGRLMKFCIKVST